MSGNFQTSFPKFKTAAFPSKYIQGPGAFAEIPNLIKSLGSKGLVIASQTVIEKVLRMFVFEHESNIFIEEFRGECSETELERLSNVIRETGADVIIGAGGGKVIDSAKIVADRSRIPVVIAPTIASSDAPCSGCAVIYSDEGVFESVYGCATNPSVVLSDTAIIAKAPVRYLVAGIGDALATWFEARSCDRTGSPNECGGLGTMTGLNLSKLCYDTIFKYAEAAIVSCERGVATPAFERVVEANILLSGIGFESSGLAAAHSIHNGLSAIKETHKYLHGEKVAFGVLAGLILTDASPEEIDSVYRFCEKVGLPTTFADIGIEEIDENDLRRAAEKTCAPEESITKEAVQATADKVLSAMIAADALGTKRKG